jgi:hypothetical protein
MNVAWRLGARRLLAASCWKCGKLLPGSAFHYHMRCARDVKPYIDRRCADCKWGTSVKGKRSAICPTCQLGMDNHS